MSNTPERDPFIGELFLDKDPRSFQRRIKVLGFKDNPKTRADEGGLRFWPRVIKNFAWATRPKYKYVVVSNSGQPETIGRKGTISAKTLKRRYTKVSR